MNLPHFRQAAVMPPDLLSYHQLSVRRLSALSSSPKDFSNLCRGRGVGLASSVKPPGPSSDPFDEVDGVRPRRVFPDEVFSFEELNEFATSARWTASRRRKSEV